MQNIDKLTKEAELYEKMQSGKTGGKVKDKVKCFACAHSCEISDGNRGICAVRFNDNGKLMAPFGYASGLAIDPVEKKPFYHFLPGEKTVSFGMLGCNFKCEFCQNYTISQIAKDKKLPIPPVEQATPEDIVNYAKQTNSKFINSTYNEPFITVEWAKAVFEKAKKENIYCGFVSNGYASEKSLQYISPFLDGCNIDLKSFNDASYKRVMGGSLKPVLDTISKLKSLNIWVEVITLIIEGFNDSDKELSDIAKFIKSVSPSIPWHITAFYPAYKWKDKTPTSVDTLTRAYNLGKSEGLNFVYTGNIGGKQNGVNTYCPKCGELLIERDGFGVCENKLSQGQCPKCETAVEGLWV